MKSADAFEVPADAAGMRLDRFLAEPLGSRARAQALIDAEHVRVDGLVRPKRYLVAPGERVEVEEREAAGSDARASDAAPFAIAYEDEHLLVVDKPAGVVVHPARGHWTGTLAQALAGRGAGGEEPWRAGIVHRLDRETSGLLVVAKDDARAPGAQGAAVGAADPPRVPGPGGRPSAGAHGHDRRADRPSPPRPRADVDRHRHPAGGTHALRAGAAAGGAPRCCASRSRPGARTRSASTWRRSGIPCAAIRSTGWPAATACAGSSCTRLDSPSIIPSRTPHSTSARRSRPI